MKHFGNILCKKCCCVFFNQFDNPKLSICYCLCCLPVVCFTMWAVSCPCVCS